MRELQLNELNSIAGGNIFSDVADAYSRGLTKSEQALSLACTSMGLMIGGLTGSMAVMTGGVLLVSYLGFEQVMNFMGGAVDRLEDLSEDLI